MVLENYVLNLFLYEIFWLIYIIFWGNWNWSNIWHIPLFLELLSYYHIFNSQELNDELSAISDIGVYIHHIIVSIVSVYYWVTNLKGWSWIFIFIWVYPNVFYGLTECMSNLYDTPSLIKFSSGSGVKSIGLPVLGSSLVHMEAKVKLNV